LVPKSPTILPKFSQKLADFRPDFCRFCRFLLPRQTAKALYTFAAAIAAAIAAASGMYNFVLPFLQILGFSWGHPLKIQFLSLCDVSRNGKSCSFVTTSVLWLC
jgi:hypothetical protein